ncbi:MAG: amidohydrolase [Thermofilum sp.]|nr:amidohydrolase [Thermofilum sp.]
MAGEALLVNFRYLLNEEVEALVVVPGKGVVCEGSEHKCRGLHPSRTLDLGGRIVVPGLRDAHTHLLSTALSRRTLDLRGVSSVEELKEAVRKAALEIGPGGWVVGRGWDQDKMVERRYPTRHDLDEAAPENPVLLVRVCGHAAVANTRALEKLGLLSGEPEELRGMVVREDGEPTGLLVEDAVSWAMEKIPRPGRATLKELLRKVIAEYLRYGVTAVHSMSVDLEELLLVRELELEGELKLRYEAYVKPELLGSIPEELRHLVRGVKAFADGSFGARTAALRERYSDFPGSGTLLMRAEEIAELARVASSQGLELAVHAIGDRAVEEVLRAAEMLHGWIRVEHASLTPPDLLELFSQLRPAVAVQPHFILSDTWIVERLGERTRWVYAFKSLARTGSTLMGSSDSPVEPLNPWLGVYAAVHRGEPEGLPIAGYTGGEKLSLREAVGLYAQPASRPEDIVVLNITKEPVSRDEFASVRAERVFLKGVELLPP